jgi:hypothetical protein
LTNSTSKKAIKLHGYDKMTRPHLSIQTKVKISRTSPYLGLAKKRLGLDARLVRVFKIESSLEESLRLKQVQESS